MSILLQNLIADIPKDVETRVKKAVKDHRDKIREALHLHTGMTLRRYDDDLFGLGNYETINIGIGFRPGLPTALQPRDMQEIDEQHRLAILLGPHRRDLRGLKTHGEAIASKLVPAIVSAPVARRLLTGDEVTVEHAWRFAQRLLESLEKFQLTQFILRIEEDIFGVYDLSGADPKIDLYWGVLGLVARDLDVEVEELTCVVLAHELAHAFTHVGADANHVSWDTTRFQGAETPVKEGLAQYFTGLVCRQLKVRGVFEAYEKLLEQQPAAYRVHIEWPLRPENVRLAMMKMRRTSGPASSLAVFQKFLDDASAQLDSSIGHHV